MNLYLLLALAFGAFTGVADVRVPRAAVTVSVRAERRVSLAARRMPHAVVTNSGSRHAASGERFVFVTPLTSALSPRAPAVNC